MMEAVDITNLSFNILADDGMSNEDLYCSMWYLAYITLILKLSTARIAKKYRFLIWTDDSVVRPDIIILVSSIIESKIIVYILVKCQKM